MVLRRPVLLAVGLLFALPAAAQPTLHPNMGMVPPGSRAPEGPPYAAQTSSSAVSPGYGAYFRFMMNRTDFGYTDPDATPPFEVSSVRLDLNLSYYAGSFVPDRGTAGFDGNIYALTGGPNAGGALPGLYWIDAKTGNETRLGDADPGFPDFGWTGMAFDPSTDHLFAIATNCEGTSKLYRSDPPFTSLTLEGSITGELICPINLMIDGHGHRYTLDVGLSQANDFLYRIDDLAALRLPLDAGFDAAFAQGGAFEAISERMLMANIRTTFSPAPRQGAPEGEIRMLDLGSDGEPTGSTTLLGPFTDDGDIEANFFTFPYPSTTAAEPATPSTFALSDAYPNPFNPAATLTLRLAATQHVRATLHDALGREVAVLQDGVLAGGPVHYLLVEAEALPSGLYVLRVTGERFAATRSLTLVR